jgi:peptide/nickel transport system ATP-binding protein
MTGNQDERLLDVQNLRKYFPIYKGFFRKTVGNVRAVDDVNFTVHKGELLSLVGESGCGKTTTARCIMRGYTPTSGKILLHTEKDHPIDLATIPYSQLRALRPKIQMIFQDPISSLNPRMTVHDIIAEGLVVNQMGTSQERTDRVAEMMKFVGLRPEFMRRFPHAFSGGERQRIGIAHDLSVRWC